MSDSDRPPGEGGESGHGEPPPSPRSKERRRRRLEGVIPEIVKRAVELGVEKARESPETVKQFVGDLKLPKEIAHYVFAQIDETKNGLFRVVAKEIRDFLEQTNFAGEMQKLLTTVQFEVNTTIRFTPNEQKKGKKAAAAPEEPASPPETAGEERDEPDSEDDLDDDREEREGGEPEVAAADDDRASLPTPEVKTTLRRRHSKST
jgi:hypothetical protein